MSFLSFIHSILRLCSGGSNVDRLGNLLFVIVGNLLFCIVGNLLDSVLLYSWEPSLLYYILYILWNTTSTCVENLLKHFNLHQCTLTANEAKVYVPLFAPQSKSWKT